MAFEETREQQQMYNYFRSCIYIFLIIEIVMNLPVTADNRVTQFILDLLARFKVFNTVSGCKLAELVCICIVCIGTKAKKALKFNVRTIVVYPVLAGLTLVGLCFVFHGMYFGVSWFGFPANRILYALCSVVGTMLVHQGLDGIAKYYNNKVGEDRFNFENESFQQSEALVANNYSVNIPMIYYWKRKMHRGWINIINPFRGTIVLGTPGSGKSFGVIDPFIRQHAAKGFAMMVYDFKYPTLAKTLFYQFCKNRKAGRLPANCGFRTINFTDVEYSDRINPIQRKYIPRPCGGFGNGGDPAGIAQQGRWREERRFGGVLHQFGGELPRGHHLLLRELPPRGLQGRQEAQTLHPTRGKETGNRDTELGRLQRHRQGRERGAGLRGREGQRCLHGRGQDVRGLERLQL